MRPPWTPSRPSSSASSRGSPSSCPISSTGHLRIVPAFLGWEDPGAAFTAVTQLGTMAAVLIYFRADLWRIANDVVPQPARPGAARRSSTPGWAGTSASARSRSRSSGLLFRDQIETGARSLYLIGTTLIVLGLLLLLAEQVGQARPRHRATINAPRRGADRLRAGAGADPGRLALGRDDHRRPVRRLRPRVRRPLLVPAVGPGGRALRAVRGAQDRRARAARASSPTLLATIAAFIVGYASIAWLLRWLTSHSMVVFVVYRVVLGVARDRRSPPTGAIS